jgi:hypothetical protein
VRASWAGGRRKAARRAPPTRPAPPTHPARAPPRRPNARPALVPPPPPDADCLTQNCANCSVVTGVCDACTVGWHLNTTTHDCMPSEPRAEWGRGAGLLPIGRVGAGSKPRDGGREGAGAGGAPPGSPSAPGPSTPSSHDRLFQTLPAPTVRRVRATSTPARARSATPATPPTTTTAGAARSAQRDTTQRAASACQVGFFLTSRRLNSPGGGGQGGGHSSAATAQTCTQRASLTRCAHAIHTPLPCPPAPSLAPAPSDVSCATANCGATNCSVVDGVCAECAAGYHLLGNGTCVLVRLWLKGGRRRAPMELVLQLRRSHVWVSPAPMPSPCFAQACASFSCDPGFTTNGAAIVCTGACDAAQCCHGGEGGGRLDWFLKGLGR